MAQVFSDKVLTNTERDQLQVIALLVRQLGGKAVISDSEMQESYGHLVLTQRYHESGDLVFEVKGK